MSAFRKSLGGCRPEHRPKGHHRDHDDDDDCGRRRRRPRLRRRHRHGGCD